MQVTQACWLSDRSGTDTYADHVGAAILASHFEYMPDGTDTQKTIVLPVATLLGQWQTTVLHTFFLPSHLFLSHLPTPLIPFYWYTDRRPAKGPDSAEVHLM